jgi:hypothetical protein
MFFFGHDESIQNWKRLKWLTTTVGLVEGQKAASTMMILAVPVAPFIKMKNEKIVMSLLHCLCHFAAPWEDHLGHFQWWTYLSLLSCTQTAYFILYTTVTKLFALAIHWNWIHVPWQSATTPIEMIPKIVTPVHCAMTLYLHLLSHLTKWSLHSNRDIRHSLLSSSRIASAMSLAIHAYHSLLPIVPIHLDHTFDQPDPSLTYTNAQL